MYKALITVLFIFQLSAVVAEPSREYYFDYNTELKACYQSLLDLDIPSSRHAVERIINDQPYNLAAIHIENYIDFMELFVLENTGRFKDLKRNKSRRIRILKKHLPRDNAYRDFAIAEINLQWSLVRSKFGELFRAGHELYTAYRYLEKNNDSHPDFIYNKKPLSLVHALIETIELPGLVKNIFGINCSIDLALDEIKTFIEWSECENSFFLEEANAIFSYIQFYQNMEQNKALSNLMEQGRKKEQHLLTRYLTVHLLVQNKQNDAAIAYFKDNFDASDYEKLPYLYFLHGNCLLRKADRKALDYLVDYTIKFEGQHYIKEAYQKLAWYYLAVENSRDMYSYYMTKVLNNGSDLMDADRYAHAEAMSDNIPEPSLLKSRLLFDGGYYNAALDVIQNVEAGANNDLEITYRKARIYQGMGNMNRAVALFSQLIDNGYPESDYRICNAALQMGLLYEKAGLAENAKKWYEYCLNLNPEDYKRGLHQKARSGLERLEKW